MPAVPHLDMRHAATDEQLNTGNEKLLSSEATKVAAFEASSGLPIAPAEPRIKDPL